MKLPLIILVLLVIIILAYFISGRLLRKKDGNSESIKSTPKIEDTPEEEIYTRQVMSGSLKSTRNKMRAPKEPGSSKGTDSPKNDKKKESTKKGEKRKYSPRKKKEDKGDDLLLS